MRASVDYTWSEGVGQLTLTGMKQENQLGKKMRNRYLTQTNLLPNKYKAGTMHVLCSSFDRTIMSAQWLLMGLFPLGTGPVKNLSKGYQAVPFRTVSGPSDMMVPDNKCNPFDFGTFVREIVFLIPEWQAKQQSLQANFPAWSAATAYSITGLYDLKQLGDALDISQRNKAPLPAGLSSSDIATIIDAGAWAYWNLYKNQAVGQASSASLLQDIYTRLQNATQPNQTLKYMLYSAHISTLMALLSALGAPVSAVSPYASDLTLRSITRMTAAFSN